MGTVPACVWSGAGGAGGGAVYLSRNRLTGDIGALGAHVHTVSAHSNSLSGNLGASVSAASASIENLDLSDNGGIDGDLEFVRKTKRLKTLHVANNKLADGGGGAGAAMRAIASRRGLRSYDVAGNHFADRKSVV